MCLELLPSVSPFLILSKEELYFSNIYFIDLHDKTTVQGTLAMLAFIIFCSFCL